MLLWAPAKQVQILESYQEENNQAHTEAGVHQRSFFWEVSILFFSLLIDWNRATQII